MLQAGGAGDGELPGQRLRIAGVRLERFTLLGEGVLDRRVTADIGDTPRLRTVGDRSVGQDHHRRVIGDRDAGGLDGGLEAVRRRSRGQHRNRGFAVAAEHGLQQIGLFGLGRQTRGRAAALHVDDDQRKFGHHGQPDRLRLQRDARTRGAGDAERATVGRADRRTDAGDLVLGLERHHVEVLVLGQLVQDVRGGGDRIGAQDHLHVAQQPRGDQSVGQRGVAGDLPVLAGLELGRGHLVGGAEGLGRLAVVPARLQRQHVGLGDLGLAGELLPDERLAVLEFAAVHPRQQTEGEHVLGALAVLLRRPDRFDRTESQRRHGDRLHDVVGEFVGLERVGLVADLGEVALGELVGVGDDQTAAG